MQTLWPEGERREKKTPLEAFSSHCLRSLDRSGNKDRMRNKNVTKWKVHPFKCPSAKNKNWFCSLSPLLHYCCRVWASPMEHRVDFPLFHTRCGEQSTRNSAANSYPSDNLGPFCSSIVFCGLKAKIIAFIWCWVTDLIRKSWLKRFADFFFFCPLWQFHNK